jgi:hypothetical protein
VDELARTPGFQYVSLGEFGDECEAIQAYRRSTHQIRLEREAEEAGGAGFQEPGPGPEPE